MLALKAVVMRRSGQDEWRELAGEILEGAGEDA